MIQHTASRLRRLGALVLLLAWAPVATANAVTCGIWCEINGGLSGHHASDMHDGHGHDGTEPGQAGSSISATNCGSPGLLIVSAVTPEAIELPTLTVAAGDPPVPSLVSFESASLGYTTPPPRA
jgi:hypothetical protein